MEPRDEQAPEQNSERTKIERASDRELRVTRMFEAPAARVFAAWSNADLFRRWWIPRSYGMTLLSCEMDVRTGGTYRLEIAHPEFASPMAFFGTYIEVVPNERLVWSNEESEGGAVTAVSFAECDGKTLVTLTETYPTAAALEESIGAASGLPDQFEQLDALLAQGCGD